MDERALQDFLSWCSARPERGGDGPPMGVLYYWVYKYIEEKK